MKHSPPDAAKKSGPTGPHGDELDCENVKAQFEILKNQINPHFLFNSFNTLLELIELDSAKAADFVRHLSKVYRFVLQTRNHPLARLGEEWAILESYLFLLKARFGEHLKVTMELSEIALGKSVVPLTLQILLEHALGHNVASEMMPLDISIISLPGDESIRFTNSIQEKRSVPSPGPGLENIIRRYRLVSDAKVAIEKSETEFAVTVPLIDPFGD